jgi:hypothetical protein
MVRQSAGELERQVGQGLTTLANGIIEMRKAMDAELDWRSTSRLA